MRSAATFFCALLAGCSSIPDVQFTDDAGPGAAGPSSSRPDGGSGSAEAGAGDGGGSAADYSCPNNPPKQQSIGICCVGSGDRLCLKCNVLSTDCARCKDQNCNNGEVCCARSGSDKVDCKRPEDC